MNTRQSIPWSMVPALGFVVAVVTIFPAAHAAFSSTTRIQQGQTVYVSDTIDISGVVPPYPQLAYWDGTNMYDSTPTYIITLPANQTIWYNFYLDPAIFATRLGAWYKYDSTIGYEPNGNSLAFVVAEPNIARIMSTVPLSTITRIVTPVPTPSTPSSPTPARTPVSTPAAGIFETGGNAVIISLIIVGLVFGFFTLIESKFWSGK